MPHIQVRQLQDTLDHKKNIQHALIKGPPGGVQLLQKFLPSPGIWQWDCRVPPAIMEEKGRHRAYDATCAGDMIRFARNLLEHVPRPGTSAWAAAMGEEEMETEGVISQGAIEGRRRTVAFLNRAFPGLNVVVFIWNEALQRHHSSISTDRESL